MREAARRFEFEKAADDMPATPLVSATDFALPGQGLTLVYGRSFGSSLFDRFRPHSGRLGLMIESKGAPMKKVRAAVRRRSRES
jgi:hypothetical protein